MINLNELLDYEDNPEYGKAMEQFYKENEKEFWSNPTNIRIMRMLSDK